MVLSCKKVRRRWVVRLRPCTPKSYFPVAEVSRPRRRSLTSPPLALAGMTDALDRFEIADIAAGILPAAVVWLDAAARQDVPTPLSLELGSKQSGTLFEIEHRYSTFQQFMPGMLVSDGNGGYVVKDLLGRMLGPNAELTDDEKKATMPWESLLEEWGDDAYHIAPRVELWRQHPQLASLLVTAVAQTSWTEDSIRAHPRFAAFLAFIRAENDDPSLEFDGDQENVEAWVDWLTEDEDPPAAAPAAAPTAVDNLGSSEGKRGARSP